MIKLFFFHSDDYMCVYNSAPRLHHFPVFTSCPLDCVASSSYQWYSWGPPNMQCRLCASCWTYWKKYGGLKMPTRLDGERPGPNRSNMVRAETRKVVFCSVWCVHFCYVHVTFCKILEKIRFIVTTFNMIGSPTLKYVNLTVIWSKEKPQVLTFKKLNPPSYLYFLNFSLFSFINIYN